MLELLLKSERAEKNNNMALKKAQLVFLFQAAESN